MNCIPSILNNDTKSNIYLFRESQYLVGFVLRRDLQLAIENARSRQDSLPGHTLCVFTHHLPVVGSGPPPLKMRKIVDLAPITITDQVTVLLQFKNCRILL